MRPVLERAHTCVLLGALLAWSVPIQAAATSARPNIILIVVDTLRADRLSQYGYTRDTSSALSKLADVATRFDETYSPAPWTKPAVASLFTGLPPTVHRVDRVGSVLGRRAVTLAEQLQSAGWSTAAVTFNPHITRKARFDQGFDEFVSYRGSVARAPDVREMTRVAWDWIQEETDSDSRKPFFLYLQPMNVHGPYRVPDVAKSALLGRPPAPGFEFFGPLMKAILNEGHVDRRSEITPAFLTSMNERYDTAVRHTADQLAAFFERLDAAGLWDDSLVVLTSDHGEELYDHGGFSHRYSLHREVLRVPLFVKLPGSAKRRVVAEPVSLTDLYATILDLAGLPARGTSLRPFLEPDGRIPMSLLDRSLVAQVRNPRRCQARAIRQGRHSLVAIDRNYEGVRNHIALYDVVMDPAEKNDLRAAQANLAADLLAELERTYKQSKGVPWPRATYELDPEEKAALEALGYF